MDIEETSAAWTTKPAPESCISILQSTERSIVQRSAVTTCRLEVAAVVLDVIVNNSESLNRYLKQFGLGECWFEGGFDYLPTDCWLAFEEQATLLQGIFLLRTLG
jgi:hypothetical protein